MAYEPPSWQPGRARADDVRYVALTLFAERGYHGTTMSDIAATLDVRVPTLYSHITSKQSLLVDIFNDTMIAVWSDYERAIDGVTDTAERLRRAIEVYALRHATHRREALVVQRELPALVEPARSHVLTLRHKHEHAIRGLIADGIESEVFRVGSVSLASLAILEMCVGIASWFREDGPLSADEVARQYGNFALSVAVGQTPAEEP